MFECLMLVKGKLGVKLELAILAVGHVISVPALQVSHHILLQIENLLTQVAV